MGHLGSGQIGATMRLEVLGNGVSANLDVRLIRNCLS